MKALERGTEKCAARSSAWPLQPNSTISLETDTDIGTTRYPQGLQTISSGMLLPALWFRTREQLRLQSGYAVAEGVFMAIVLRARTLRGHAGFAKYAPDSNWCESL